MLRVVTNQQELTKSKSKSYIEGGIKAVKATGIEDRKILFGEWSGHITNMA